MTVDIESCFLIATTTIYSFLFVFIRYFRQGMINSMPTNIIRIGHIVYAHNIMNPSPSLSADIEQALSRLNDMFSLCVA